MAPHFFEKKKGETGKTLTDCNWTDLGEQLIGSLAWDHPQHSSDRRSRTNKSFEKLTDWSDKADVKSDCLTRDSERFSGPSQLVVPCVDQKLA